MAALATSLVEKRGERLGGRGHGWRRTTACPPHWNVRPGWRLPWCFLTSHRPRCFFLSGRSCSLPCCPSGYPPGRAWREKVARPACPSSRGATGCARAAARSAGRAPPPRGEAPPARLHSGRASRPPRPSLYRRPRLHPAPPHAGASRRPPAAATGAWPPPHAPSHARAQRSPSCARRRSGYLAAAARHRQRTSPRLITADPWSCRSASRSAKWAATHSASWGCIAPPSAATAGHRRSLRRVRCRWLRRWPQARLAAWRRQLPPAQRPWVRRRVAPRPPPQSPTPRPPPTSARPPGATPDATRRPMHLWNPMWCELACRACPSWERLPSAEHASHVAGAASARWEVARSGRRWPAARPAPAAPEVSRPVRARSVRGPSTRRPKRGSGRKRPAQASAPPGAP
eukprot:scaffold11375_cov123-Isochrysis_galbana.AAC.9